MDSNKFGLLITELRHGNNLTQEELGDKLGISVNTISEWECGTSLPDVLMLKKISKVFNISVSELFDGVVDDTLRKKIKKKRYILILVLVVLSFFLIFIITRDKKVDESNSSYKCKVVRTYYIDGISGSNNSNFLYVTLHEYQMERTYTIKLPTIVNDEIKVGNNYEFTFMTSKEHAINEMTDILFDNSEIINVEYTNKVGNEVVSTYSCN